MGCLKVVWASPHLALEAEDGDRQTHQSGDSQTQNHWLGVVEAGGREGITCYRCWRRRGHVLVSHRVFTWTRIPSWKPCSKSGGKSREILPKYHSEAKFVFYFMMFSCYLQREPTEWYSRETASCLGERENALYEQKAPSVSCTVCHKGTLPQLPTAGQCNVGGKEHETAEKRAQTMRPRVGEKQATLQCGWRRWVFTY